MWLTYYVNQQYLSGENLCQDIELTYFIKIWLLFFPWGEGCMGNEDINKFQVLPVTCPIWGAYFILVTFIWRKVIYKRLNFSDLKLFLGNLYNDV